MTQPNGGGTRAERPGRRIQRPKAKAALEGIPTYKPGRRPDPAPDRPTYKLSSNETPMEPLPELQAAIARAAAGVNRYPDTACTRLTAKLAERLDLPTDRFAVGTGSVSLIYHLVQAFCEPGDEVVYAWRSFEAYPIATQVAGVTAVTVPLAPGARHDLDAMADAVTERTKIVFLCTPNNPTGPAIRRDELERFLDRVPERVLVVIDEAYVQFVRDPEAADGLAVYRARPNVCVLRTFSKAYGLANLRIGFAVARPEVATAIRLCTLPFPVSTLAEDAALAALDLEPALFARVEAIVEERLRVLEGLRAHGLDVPDSEANFVWVRLGDRTDEFAIACEAEGVVVRPFAGDGCRVTIGEPAANSLVLDIAAAWAKTH